MLKTVVVLPDTTTLLNFGIAGRVDLLERFASSGAAWCGTVSSECADQAQRYGLPDLWQEGKRIFGDPWLPDGAEHQDVQTLREQMLQPGESEASKHLGEAETITIATSMRFSQSWQGRRPAFVTDDLGAQAAARRAEMTAVDTWGVLALLVRSGRATLDECVRAGEEIVAAGRPGPREKDGTRTSDVRGWMEPHG